MAALLKADRTLPLHTTPLHQTVAFGNKQGQTKLHLRFEVFADE